MNWVTSQVDAAECSNIEICIEKMLFFVCFLTKVVKLIWFYIMSNGSGSKNTVDINFIRWIKDQKSEKRNYMFNLLSDDGS